MNDCIEVHSLRTYSLNCIDTSIINAKCIISAALSCNPPALFMWKKQSVLTGFSYFSVVKENSEQYYESNTITLMTYERLMFILCQMLQTLSDIINPSNLCACVFDVSLYCFTCEAHHCIWKKCAPLSGGSTLAKHSIFCLDSILFNAIIERPFSECLKIWWTPICSRGFQGFQALNPRFPHKLVFSSLCFETVILFTSRGVFVWKT